MSEVLSIAELVKADDVLASISSRRKYILLAIICVATFLDTFSNSALFTAIPPISQELSISNSNSVWLLSGYQLTFASLLLISGRLSDLYNPKIIFIIGGVSLGSFSLGSGFVRAEVPLIVLRALMGVGAALTVPSALHMIIHMFPDPATQSGAIAAFAAAGATGNVLGLIIGAIFVSFATWPWVFWFIAIVAMLESILVFLICPTIDRGHSSVLEKATRFQRLDLIGVGMFTISLILFIFAVTSGSIDGWGTAKVIAPLIISVVLMAAFFGYEAWLPENLAAVPAKTWKYTNFSILIATALLPFTWWGVVQSLYSWLWQEVYGWSPIITAVHFLPLGAMGFTFSVVSGILQQRMRLKWVMFLGGVLAVIGTLLLPFANSRQRYWSFVFPGFIIGSAGVTIVFATINITVFVATPPEAAGVVGAIFNCALQVGCAAGVAIVTSIQTSIEGTHGGPRSYDGRAAGFWFLFAFTTIIALALLILKDTLPPIQQRKAPTDGSMESNLKPSESKEGDIPVDSSNA